jgi:hypothetical protein
MNDSRALSTIACCHDARKIGRRCLRPGPCCGIQARPVLPAHRNLDAALTGALVTVGVLAGDHCLHCRAALSDDARIRAVHRHPQLPHRPPAGRDTAVSQVHAEQIAVGPRRESRRIVAVDTLDSADAGRAPSRRQTRQAEIHAVTPFPNCAAWDSSRASNLTIVKALPNKLTDSLYFGARSH